MNGAFYVCHAGHGRQIYTGISVNVFDRALAAHKNGRFNEAEELYRAIVSKDAKNFDALHMLALVCSEVRKIAEAEQFFLAAASIDSKYPPLFHNYGLFLAKLKRYRDSIEQFDRALKLFNKFAPAYCDRGISLMELGRLDEALASHNAAASLAPDVPVVFCNRGNVFLKKGNFDLALQDYDRAIKLHGAYADAYCGRGNALRELRRHDEAIAAYDTALVLKSDLAEAWLGRGNLLHDCKRHDEAAAAYSKALGLKPDSAEALLGCGNAHYVLKRYSEAMRAYNDALALKPDLAGAWLGRGNVSYRRRHYALALADYDKAVAFKSDLAEAWLGRGNSLCSLKDYNEALAAFERAVALAPELAEAWLGRGNVYSEMKSYDAALAAYDKALSLNSDLAAEAWFGRGNILLELKRYDDAFADFDKALNLKPDLEYVAGQRLRAKLQISDWSNLEADVAQLLSEVRDGKISSDPFVLLAIESSAADQLRCAERHVPEQPSSSRMWQNEAYSHDRIRVAYVSSDFREHPMGHLTVGLFEHHDKSRFELMGISLGPQHDSVLYSRIKASFESFIDGGARTDHDLADVVRGREIDILVDLNGHTRGNRLGVFARRPAPLQVNYLGYAGTMGATFYDYIMADQTIIPKEHFEFYSEKVVWLPDSYKINASLPEKDNLTRREHHLPDSGFIFCCFNNTFRITPPLFDTWMRLLHQIDGSVLWLLEDNALAAANLRLEAERRGVASRRLVFAPRVSLSAHLGRQHHADLFLDTLHFNAHKTASDALCAGVPVLTRIGSTFASRVAASLLRAAGLPELVTESLADYEFLALKIARDPSFLAALKVKVARNRETFPLFDTARLTHNIEAAYATMWQWHQRGEPARSFGVPV